MLQGCILLPPVAGAASVAEMEFFSAQRRRIAMAICITLSACAAAPSGSRSDRGALGESASGAAYGAFLAAHYADAQQDPADAVDFYQKALAADPHNPSLLAEGFVAALLAGSPSAAAMARQTPGGALALMLLGNRAALAGDYGGAARDYQALPTDDLSNLIKPLLLAWCAAGAGQAATGVAALEPYFTGGNFSPVYVLNAALIADAAGDTRDAAQFYAAVNAGAAPNLRLAQIIASWQARQGQMEAAEAELAALIAANPDLRVALPALKARIAVPVIGVPTDGLAETYLTLAGLLDQPSQTLLRITFLQFALTLRPDLAAARLLLASLQAGGLGGSAPPTPAQLNQALATLRPVPATDPLFGVAAMQEATLLAALNRPDEAVALLNKVAAGDPGDPVPLAAAGDVLRGNGQFAQATAAYDKAIAATGQPPPAEAWTLYFDRGIAEDQAGDWHAAEPDLVQALALSPDQPYVLNYLGYSWALKGEKLADAQRMLQQANGLDPNDGAVIDSLGYVTLKQGHSVQATLLLTQAVERDPDDAEVNAHLGDAFWAEGMKLQAGYQWQRALGLKPDAKLQAEIEAKLKQAGQS